ncbi:hypothetical protein DL765_009591 [Monosporascus sp. GIB2]|nr:hypothetical protein DL765_009591 [Monosporascus sp. GIB2]
MKSKVNYWRSELARSPQALLLLAFSISGARKPVLRPSGSMDMDLNLLPLRLRLNRSQQFQEALTDTRRKAYGGVANSDLPFDVLLDKLHVPWSTL